MDASDAGRLLARERRRLGIKNVDPPPERCPKCGAALESGDGYVGEEVLYCPNGHGIFWEDSEEALRRIL